MSKTHSFPVRTRIVRGKNGGVAAPIIFLLIAAGALALFYFASLSKGTREEFAEAQAVQADPVMAEKMLSSSRSAESQFNAIHEFKKDQITSEDIDVFEKAVTAYQSYLEYSGSAAYNPRYEQLRLRLHNLRADDLRKRTVKLETEAEDLASQKKYQEAEKLFDDAARLEFRITKEFPLASKNNHARANFLENRAKTMRALPLQFRAKQLEEEGEAALKAANWPKANLCLKEALDIEKELWANYRNVIVSNNARILRVQDLIATVNSAPDYERREREIAAAREEEQNGNWSAAAGHWAKALDTQKRIIQNFPRSFYAKEEVAREITANWENAAAYPQFLELSKDYDTMCADIRARTPERVPQLAKQTLRRAENIRREYPNSTLVSKEFLQELQYMDLKAPAVSSVQSSFFKMIQPIPGVSEQTQMLKTEVSQALYTFIMPFNPSVRKEHTNPVDSVDFNDAQEFCRRLSLLIGLPVRLPTQTEFSAAAGTPNSESILSQAWLIENSSGQVHAVGKRQPNAAGFFDLYGNVAEWVLDDNSKSIAKKDFEEFIAGGDCQTPTYSFPEDFFRKVARSEKSRTRGFRVVVELSAEPVSPKK